MSKKIIYLIILLSISFVVCYSQQNPEITEDEDVFDNSKYITSSVVTTSRTRFGSGMPENSFTKQREKTKDEYVFKTYIMDKLLKSNRILY